ncbi:hypothetical protein TNCV_4550391 [Trichonephila clavipes]|nr:hypothetical protein TNCV_4550391 [Trichonephila clavipes]
MHHKVSHGGFHRSKREAHITKKRRITTQTSLPSPGFEPSPYGIAVSVTNHSTGWAASIAVSHLDLCDVLPYEK